MKYVRTTLSSLMTVLKPMAIAAACALFLFANASPALAFGDSSSQPSKGLEQLDGVQEKSEQALNSGPTSDANGTKGVTKDAKEGLNGVQGAANKGDMISPEEANAQSVENVIEDSLQELK